MVILYIQKFSASAIRYFFTDSQRQTQRVAKYFFFPFSVLHQVQEPFRMPKQGEKKANNHQKGNRTMTESCTIPRWVTHRCSNPMSLTVTGGAAITLALLTCRLQAWIHFTSCMLSTQHRRSTTPPLNYLLLLYKSLCFLTGEHLRWKGSKLWENHLAHVFKIAYEWINGLPPPLPLAHCFNILSFMSDFQTYFILCCLPRQAFLGLRLFLCLNSNACLYLFIKTLSWCCLRNWRLYPFRSKHHTCWCTEISPDAETRYPALHKGHSSSHTYPLQPP